MITHIGFVYYVLMTSTNVMADGAAVVGALGLRFGDVG